MTRLATDRLLLRRARPDDLDALHRILADPIAMQYWSSAPHADIEVTRRWISDMMAADPATSEDFVVECEGRLIGKVGAWRLPEIGYIFHPDSWGHGYATEALEALIGVLFARPLDHLTADVDPRNRASIKLLARLGFTETGRAARTCVVGGVWSDSVYFRRDRLA